MPWRSELPDVYQIHVTTRDREAMPLLRYHTGDIVQRFPPGFRLLGREGNRYFRADGSLVSPADIDAALAAMLGGGARAAAFRRKFITPAASGKFALLKPLAK